MTFFAVSLRKSRPARQILLAFPKKICNLWTTGAARRGQTPMNRDPRLRISTSELIPEPLLAKCRHLVETYHGMHGYGSLPNILWQPGPREFIETYDPFGPIFKRACRMRSAAHANEGFVLIAATILSLEVLASDFGNWSAKYPAAKRLALTILKDCATQPSRTHLMDRYIYPRSYINPAFIDVFASSDSN
jgi:hypothetical protein